MSYYPNLSNGPAQSAPPSYSEAVGGVYASTPMGFYPPTAPNMPKEQIPNEPPIVTAVVPLGPSSTRMICPQCNSQISTNIKTQPGIIAYVSGALIALFGCWLGCCLIPCCIDDCMDIHHTCPQCKTYLGSCICGCCLIPCCVENFQDTYHKCPSCGRFLGSHKIL